LISGFLAGTESAEETAVRIIGESTGLEHTQPEQIFSFSRFCEDYGEVAVSIAYYVMIHTKEIHIPVTDNLKWLARKDLANNHLELYQVIECAFQKLRQKTFFNLPGLKLLPEKFTWNQLHKLYEAITEKHVDSRNLQKKFNSMRIIKRLREKEKSGSKKGSFLYSFTKAYHGPITLSTNV
jgi:ADP-ribose pyrophosphatase YjhB (NUDIX family)